MTHKRPGIKEDVIKTVAYHTAVGSAVTATEIWQWQLEPEKVWSLVEVLHALDLKDVRARLSCRDGRFVLKGHESILDGLHERFLHSDRKWRTARRYLRYPRWVPGVRAVAVCNSLALEMAKKDSDIDLFIITRKDMIWFVRLLSTVPLILLRRRPGQGHDDPICVSFLVIDSALSFEDIHLQPKDVHMAHWLLSMVPVIDDGVFQEFLSVNTWATDMFPNSPRRSLAWYRRLKNTRPVAKFGLGTLNTLAKRLQVNRMPNEIKQRQNKSSDVIVSDSMLKFHVHDRREEINQRFTDLQERAG